MQPPSDKMGAAEAVEVDVEVEKVVERAVVVDGRVADTLPCAEVVIGRDDEDVLDAEPESWSDPVYVLTYDVLALEGMKLVVT